MWQDQPIAIWQCQKCQSGDATDLVLVPLPVPTLYCKRCKQPQDEFAVNPVKQEAIFSDPRFSGQAVGQEENKP